MPEMKDIYADSRTRMGKALEALENSLSVLRTGRANPGMLKKITVEYFGSQMPLDQVAQVNAPDARTLLIQPWDRNMLGPIERAIRDSDLGFNPNNRGEGIFITIPALNEERRKELIKTAKGYAEDAKVAVRNIRREAIAEVDKLKKTVGEDEVKRAEAEVQKITDEYVKKVDEIFAKKEQDILG